MMLKIGELAKKSGLATSTIRYYEKCGLLPLAVRESNGYRYYTEDAIVQLEFIKKAQQLDFSLHDIDAILKIRLTGKEPCNLVRALLSDKINKVRVQLDTLKKLEVELLYYQKQWEVDKNNSIKSNICHLIEDVNIAK